MIQVKVKTTPADFHAFHQLAVFVGKGIDSKLWRAIAIRLACASRCAVAIHPAATLFFDRGAILGARQTSLDGTGAREQSRNHTFLAAWDEMLAVEETPARVFVMSDRFAGCVVPTRAFGDSTQVAESLRLGERERARQVDVWRWFPTPGRLVLGPVECAAITLGGICAKLFALLCLTLLIPDPVPCSDFRFDCAKVSGRWTCGRWS